jgi:hypothetical protein
VSNKGADAGPFEKEFRMFFAVDIDEVLARDVTGYATYLNRYFQLGVEQSVIEGLSGYAQFIELEAVRSFVRGNESRAAEFNRVAKEAQYAPQYCSNKKKRVGTGFSKLSEAHQDLRCLQGPGGQG